MYENSACFNPAYYKIQLCHVHFQIGMKFRALEEQDVDKNTKRERT